MTRVISRKELQDLIERSDVQIVDVLPDREYNESHIPGAVSIPLRRLTAESVDVLFKDKPTVVY